MTGGYMECPKCGNEFRYADWIDGLWTVTEEPWRCDCGSYLVVDRERGFGLKVQGYD